MANNRKLHGTPSKKSNLIGKRYEINSISCEKTRKTRISLFFSVFYTKYWRNLAVMRVFFFRVFFKKVKKIEKTQIGPKLGKNTRQGTLFLQKKPPECRNIGTKTRQLGKYREKGPLRPPSRAKKSKKYEFSRTKAFFPGKSKISCFFGPDPSGGVPGGG